jgi:MtrB/PioB family decaheme-associated outer membrane protein
MRNRLTTVTAALLLASANLVFAQQQPAPRPADTTPATGPVAVPWTGTIDFGFRPDTSSGNIAQYERYRDLQDGAFTRFNIAREGETYLFSAGARNIGYTDQEYFADFNSGRAKVAFFFDGTPLNYGYNTLTPWNIESGGRLTLDTATRTAIQNRQPGIVGIPTNAAQVAAGSVYQDLARVFELTSKRQTVGFAASVNATRQMAVDFSFQSAKRDGYQPWGAAFAFNNSNEVPLPIDNRTNDFTAGAEWANQQGMIRLAWGASWFNNDIQTLVWDNPVRATDYNLGRAPFYDASGYSNGNGPAQGRMSLAPSNNMNVISATGMYKLPYRSTFTGTFAYSTSKQNEQLIPWTINSVINSSNVLANFPHLQHLERETAEAEVRGINAQFQFNSRPNRYVGFTARYRYNDRDNRTPLFDATEYVRFDAVPEETGGHTEPYSIKHNQFDATATFNLVRYTALRVGYGRDAMDHNHRGFETLTDDTFRVSMDTVGNQYVMVRGQYEFTKRSGSNFSLDFFEGSGTQPIARLYDDAERDRNRGTLMFVFTPIQQVDFSASFSAGKDEYNGDGHELGLMSNDNTGYNFGVNVTPVSNVAMGINYGRDEFSSTQLSRNANPAPDPSWTDTNRNWSLDNDETVNNVQLYVTLVKAIKNTDVSVTYDYMDSDNGFAFGGPRIAALQALNQFQALPNVTNTWKRLTTDINYFITKRVGFGVGYWYEKYDVSDWATVDTFGPAGFIGTATGAPRVDYLGEILTGYGSRPYKGSTGFFRILYVF